LVVVRLWFAVLWKHAEGLRRLNSRDGALDFRSPIVRFDFVRGRGSRTVVVTAVLLLLIGCTRPQGALVTPTPLPSPTAVANHDPLTIAFPVFHAGETGVAYAPVTLSAAGGVAPYTWSVSVGALPGGLTLSSGGVVSGTPTQNGYFTFSVQVFDAGNNDTAGLPGTIPIVPRLTASLVPACTSECTVELGCVTVCGTFGQMSGGTAPFTYSLSSGVLPSGTSLSGLALKGTFTGLPGRLQFTVLVTDGFGATATVAPRYNLLPHLSAGTSSSCGPASHSIGCTASVPYSGGTPSSSPSVAVTGAGATLCTLQVTGALTCGPTSSVPPGFSATAGGGLVSISVPGTKTFYTYSGTVTFQLVDQGQCGAGVNCRSTTSTITFNLTR
jgi:large repetitive protein